MARRSGVEEALESVAGDAQLVAETDHGKTFPPVERARQEALLALVDQDANEIEQLVGDLSRVLAKFDQFSMKTYRQTHPKKVYRDISHAILGQRIAQVVADLDRQDPGRCERLMSVLLDAGPALEHAVDLDDPQTVARLADLFDRLEDHLRDQP